MISRYRVRIAALGAALSASPAWGCVACHSEAAHQLRNSLFAGDFTAHVLMMAAPFPFLLGAAAWLSRVLVPRA